MSRPTASDEATRRRMVTQKQSGTKPELILRSLLTELGVRYRVNPPTLPGKPDVANRSRKWVIFVHGCYWHQHEGCQRATLPKRNRSWWLEKFRKNKERDGAKVEALERIGIEVLVVWECETRDPERLRLRLLTWPALGYAGDEGADA